MATLFDMKWMTQQPWDCDRIERSIRDTKKYPEENAWEYSIKYILMTLFCKLFHIRISQRKVAEFYVEARELCRKLADGDDKLLRAYFDGLEAMWPKLQQQIREPGFYHFVRKFGMDSAFLLTYFSVLSPSAPALEAARGHSVDIAGRYREIPESDYQAYNLCVREPTFRSFGTSRVWAAQSCMLQKALDYEMKAPDACAGSCASVEKPNILFAPAGMMPEVRYYRLRPEMLKDLFGRIVAYDNDPKMPEYLKMVFERPVEEYGIDYRMEALERAFDDPELQGMFDVVVANGFMSYHKDDAETLYYLRGFHKLLKPGGVVVFDVQTLEPSMVRCAVTLAWKLPLKPDRSPKAAIGRIRKAAERAGFAEFEYEVDKCNKRPALVYFHLTKQK